MREVEELDVESVILDAELLAKYNMPERGIAALEQAVEQRPESIRLREKLCALYRERGMSELAARQCLALAGLYVKTSDLEEANRCLLEARELNPNAGITIRLQELKKLEMARQRQHAAQRGSVSVRATLAGSLSDFSIFDVVQLLENNRLTGVLEIEKDENTGRIYFTEGLIVNAVLGERTAMEAFKLLVQDANSGYFSFEKSQVGFERVIQASSNTSLILDLLREYDEEHRFDNLSEEF
jgi:tetratricopeptide (TPR) repeat protein